MGLALRNNQADFEQQIDAFASGLSVVKPRILNKLQDQALTAGLREVADVYDVGPQTMRKYVTLRLANGSDLESTITVKGKGFPLILFGARQLRNGVSVKIKGKRIVIPHAFITTMPNGHQGVFARGAYGGKGLTTKTGSFGRFIFGRRIRVTKPYAKRTELPVNELYTFAPPDAFSNPLTIAAMDDRVEEQGPKVAAQELRFARLGR